MVHTRYCYMNLSDICSVFSANLLKKNKKGEKKHESDIIKSSQFKLVFKLLECIDSCRSCNQVDTDSCLWHNYLHRGSSQVDTSLNHFHGKVESLNSTYHCIPSIYKRNNFLRIVQNSSYIQRGIGHWPGQGMARTCVDNHHYKSTSHHLWYNKIHLHKVCTQKDMF